MKRLDNMPGKLSIGHPTPGNDVVIKLIDESSYCQILEIRVPLETFARALMGHSHLDCVYDLTAMNAGKARESKTEIVRVPKKYIHSLRDDDVKAKLLKPFEVDGWRDYQNDLGNHHKSKGYHEKYTEYEVTFTRFVEPKK